MDEVQYPIGKFVPVEVLTDAQRKTVIDEIAMLPTQLRQAVAGLNDEQLDTPYRSGGWTIRQVVHHLADNDMNAYIRFKRALTEDNPTSGTYEQDRFAQLSDYKDAPVDISITLMEALHNRFVILLAKLSADAFQRPFVSPTYGPLTLERAVQMYAWHGRHHTAQITSLRERMGW